MGMMTVELDAGRLLTQEADRLIAESDDNARIALGIFIGTLATELDTPVDDGNSMTYILEAIRELKGAANYDS